MTCKRRTQEGREELLCLCEQHYKGYETSHIVNNEMLRRTSMCMYMVQLVTITCWLGGVAWGVCPVGGACPPLLSTTGMLGDVLLWWGLNESCQSTAFLFNTHTLLIPPQPVQGEIYQSHANNGIPGEYVELIKVWQRFSSLTQNLLIQDGDPTSILPT